MGGVFDFSNGYSYDRMDRLTSVTQTGRAGSHSVAPKHASFTYDAASQLTDLKRYASTSVLYLQVHSRFGRDGAGRLTSITHGGTTIAAGQQWDGSATPPASLGSSELLAGYTFAYDQANRLTELRSWADGMQTAYGYDDRSQLVSAATTAIAGMTPPFGLPGGEGYDFDAGGNRKGTGGTSQSATGTHNQLQSDGTYNYFYDGEGNLIRRESISNLTATLYEWDHRNRLVAVKVAPYYQAGPLYQNLFSHRIEYIYDAFDQRVGKQVEDTGAPIGFWGVEWKRYEAYVWADGQEVLRFTDSDGLGTTESFRLASRYLWSDQVDQLLAEEQFAGDTGPSVHATTAHTTAGETLWPLTDHLGSVRGLVDNNGIIRQHVTYDSFGNRLVEQHYDTAGAPVAASHAEAVDTLFGYTGRDWDTDTNLQYNRARWYTPSTGRWLSQDPIGFDAGDANLYRYVGNGSMGKTDPSGLDENVPGTAQPYEGPSISQAPESIPWWKVPFVRDPRSTNELKSPGMYHWIVGNLYWRLGARDTVEGVKEIYNDPMGAAYNCTIGLPGNVSSVILHWDGISDLDKQDLPAKVATGIVTGNIVGNVAGLLPVSVSRTGYKFRILSREGCTLEIIGEGPEGTLYTIPEVIDQGDTVCLRGFDIDGPGAGAFGRYELKLLVRDLVDQLGYKPTTIRIEGNPRTTGANPGKQPRPITIPME